MLIYHLTVSANLQCINTVSSSVCNVSFETDSRIIS